MMGGNLVVLNYNENLEDTNAKYTVFPTRVVLGSLNSGINMEAVQFGHELYIATGDGLYILRLVRTYIDGSDWSEYELVARRLDSTDEIYFPDGNEYQTIGENLFFEQNELVTAGSFVVGTTYTIETIGTTNFTLIGAYSNTVNQMFVATGVGSGTGTATSLPNIEHEVSNGDTLSIKMIVNNVLKGVVNESFRTMPIISTTKPTVSEVYYRVTITDPDSVDVSIYETIPDNMPYKWYSPTQTGIYTIKWEADESDPATTAGSFVTDTEYSITTIGTTDFTLIGASANTIGVKFTATGAGSGTGTATEIGVYEEEYTIQFEVVSTSDDIVETSLNYEINKCTRLFVHYNKLVVYKNDTGNWYVSDINRPAYFTFVGVNDFASSNRESVTEVLQDVTPYRNSLIALTEKSMFLVTGVGDARPDYLGEFSPFEFFKVSNKGTHAPYSVATNENNLIFLSNDGVYVLNSINEDEKKANIYKISDLIDDLVIKDEVNASGVVFENKYYLNFPSGNYILKWDYGFGQLVERIAIPKHSWNRDISIELVFKNMKIIDNTLFGIVTAGTYSSKLLQLNNKENAYDYNETPSVVETGDSYTQLLDNRTNFSAYSFGYHDVVDGNFLKIEVTSIGDYAEVNTNLGDDIEYTLIYEIDSENLTGELWLHGNSAFPTTVLPKTVGIHKVAVTTYSSIIYNKVQIYVNGGVNGEIIKLRPTLFAGDLTDLDDNTAQLLIDNAEYLAYVPIYTYTGILTYNPIKSETVTFYLQDTTGAYECVDDGNGAFTLAGRLTSGTINYTTGGFILNASLAFSVSARVNYEFNFDFAYNVYPVYYFTDDETTFQALFETKGYKFDDKSRMKKVKQVILELSEGNYTLIYSANERKIIDAKQVPTIIFTVTDGRVVSYSGTLETNIEIQGNFLLGDSDTGVLGVNILGGMEEQYSYYTLRKSSFAQSHKIILAHSEDAYAKVLGFGFKYVYGKAPR
jgi:hypothetical protein